MISAVCVNIWNVCSFCCFAFSVLIAPLKWSWHFLHWQHFFMHLVQTGVRANSCSATVNHPQIRLHVYLSLRDTSFFSAIFFQSNQTPACLPSSFLTSNFSPTFSHPGQNLPLPFHCSGLLAIIIRAVNHHHCSAVLSPTLLPTSPQPLLIVLYLHDLSTLCLSFPVYSEPLWLFLYILHG